MYYISDDEEKNNIEQINRQLKQYEKLLKLIPSEELHYSIMALGRTICESMVQLLLKKERYYNLNEMNTLYINTETLYEHEIIPNECRNFIHLIRRYANESVHGIEPTDKLVLSFLQAFNYFIQWINNHYYQNHQNYFQIEECCVLIDSLFYDDESSEFKFDETRKEFNSRYFNELKFNTTKTQKDIINIKKELEDLKAKTEKENSAKINKLLEELRKKEETQQKEIDELKEENKEILKSLKEKDKQFERCLDILYDINERDKRIESKIDDLHSKIDAISNKITTLQSFAERQLKNAQSTEKIEEIIAFYIDECIDQIMNFSQSFTENQNYQTERKKLIHSIGEEGWNKLCEKSKTFLITSKVIYNNMITMGDIIDYSGICVLVTKALEVELHKRFFTEFLEFLDEKYERDYKKYHTALLHNYRQPLFSEKFSMGDIAFVMCYKTNWEDTDEQKTNNERVLMEYCKECIFSNYTESEIKALLNKYASSIEDIRKNYRNPSAHTNEIKRIDAEECFNLVLDIEKLLKQMLDSFDR